MNLAIKIKITAVFIILLSGCAPTVVETSFSELIKPTWFDKLTSEPKTFAIFPFEGYDGEATGMARQLESNLRSRILKWGQYRLAERQSLQIIMGEQNLGQLGLTSESPVELARMVGAEIILLGAIPDYSKEENFVESVSKSWYSADEFKRTVSFSVNMRIIAVEKGEIIFEENKSFTQENLGYRNVKKIPIPKKTTFGEELLIRIQHNQADKHTLKDFTAMKESLVNEATDWFFKDLVAYKRKFEDTYILGKEGKKTLRSRKVMGIVPPNN